MQKLCYLAELALENLFTGVDIDLDDGGVLGKGLGVQGHAVRKAGAQCDQHVTVRDRPVGGVAAVHSDHADVHRVTVGHNACGHQGIGGGDLRLVDQVTQGLAGSRAPQSNNYGFNIASFC